jgi:hypothetical protein
LRILLGLTLKAAAEAAKLAAMLYQRIQFWLRRFRQQAEKAMRRSGGAHPSTGGPGFSLEGSSEVGANRLDRFSFVPVCRPPCRSVIKN